MSTTAILQSLWAAGAAFLILTVVFWPLERMFPARPGQPYFRAEWLVDTTFFFGQYLVWSSLVLTFLYYAQDAVNALPSLGIQAWAHGLPWWVQACIVLVLSDLGVYWGHRLQHRYDVLWRFHAVHHTSEHLDWLAAHREHPVDSIYTTLNANLPAFLLGFPLETLAGLVAFRGMWAIYIHSNVRLPIGPLRVLIGAPELHHWHHDRHRINGNYANLCPVLDVLFGTYRCPPHEPEAFGIAEPFPRTYLGQMLHPFRGCIPGISGATRPTAEAAPSATGAVKDGVEPLQKGRQPSALKMGVQS
ncbi:sterol desaturase family protein [Verrucomicrobia bacterium LW23]|nr:sterol desaturase family protein [Verrucomicrobia bacterium LW23]